MTESSAILEPQESTHFEQWNAPSLLKDGKMNTLWLASRHGKRFVLKGLSEEFRTSTPHLELLRKEFRIASELDHPGIVRTLDYGQSDSIGEYIQMEYVDGRTMSEWLSESPGKEARKRVLIQLLEAVSYLHQKQILHRDLKPSNILITRNGDNVKLIDFGIADTDDYILFKQAGGTKGYIAPETAEGTETDCRSDLYAIGKIISQIYPHHYRRITAKCSRHNREMRYPNIEAILRAIQREDRWLQYLPIVVVIIAMTLGVGLAIREQLMTQEQIEQQQEQISRQQTYITEQMDSIEVLRTSLNAYKEEERLIEEMTKKASTIFKIRVREPFRRGEFTYIQDLTEAMESGRKEIDKMLDAIDNEVLKTKAHSAAYDAWVRNYNQFFEIDQPYRLPARIEY